MRRMTLCLFVTMCLAPAPASAHAQAPVTPMTPSDSHERLTFFEGAWTYEEAAPDIAR